MTAPSPVPPLAAETSRVSAGPVHATRTASPASGRREQRGVGDAPQRERVRQQPGEPATGTLAATAHARAAARRPRSRPADRDRPDARSASGRADRSRESPSANGTRDPGTAGTARLGTADRPGGGATALPSDFDGPSGARDAATARQAELNGCEYKSFSLQSRPVKECAPGLVRTAFRSTRCRRAPVVWDARSRAAPHSRQPSPMGEPIFTSLEALPTCRTSVPASTFRAHAR